MDSEVMSSFSYIFAVTSMITEVDEKIVSYRLDGTNGTTHSGKVANFGFPFEFIADPADSLVDTVAVDTLFEDVMDGLK